MAKKENLTDELTRMYLFYRFVQLFISSVYVSSKSPWNSLQTFNGLKRRHWRNGPYSCILGGLQCHHSILDTRYRDTSLKDIGTQKTDPQMKRNTLERVMTSTYLIMCHKVSTKRIGYPRLLRTMCEMHRVLYNDPQWCSWKRILYGEEYKHLSSSSSWVPMCNLGRYRELFYKV